MLRRIERDEEEKRALTEEGERKDRAIREAGNRISIYREEIQAKEKEKAVEIGQIKVVYSTEVEQLCLQVKDLRAQKQNLKAEDEAEATKLKSQIELYESQLDNKDNALL